MGRPTFSLHDFLRHFARTATCTLLLLSPALLLGQISDSTRVAVEPTYLEKPELAFPEEAMGAGVTGKIWVKILVGSDGMPVKTMILKRVPEMAFMFDDAARRWAMKCRFSPARDSVGKPVAVWIGIPISFKMADFQPPTLTRLAVAEYPEEARAMGLEGWVGVAVFVNAMGNAINSRTVVVGRDPPYTKVFDEAAASAAKASEYTPATQNGRAADGWCFVKVQFSLEGR